MPLGFTGEEMGQLTTFATALPPALRGGFLQFVAARVSAPLEQVGGSGMLHRIPGEGQKDFLKGRIAVGIAPKSGREDTHKTALAKGLIAGVYS